MLNSVEFAQQLCYLDQIGVASNQEEDNTENTSRRTYVSQWLVPMLSTHQSTVIRQTEFPMISKKIRDDVIGTKHQVLQLPFRRSGLWLFMKAILQFNLTIELGEMVGKIMYKLVGLKVVGILCNFYNTKMYAKLNVDIVLHMLAKLARRIEKIDHLISLLEDEYPNKFDALPNGFEDIYNTTIDEVKLVIYKVKEKLDRQIHRVQINDEESSRLVPLSHLDFVADVHQKLPKLRKHLKTRQVPLQSNENREKVKVKCFARHLIGSLEAPDVSEFDKVKNSIDIGVFLCDFENWILYALYDVNTCTPQTLRSLSFAYARLAAKHYTDDPLGFSRTVLTQMKIFALLDKAAILKHHLLKKHRPGIYQGIFDGLLLPQYEDLEIAHDLKKYLVKRSEKAMYPSLIEEEKVTNHSFAVRFAKKSDEMQELLGRIQESANATIATIEKEWEMRRKEVDNLRKQAQTMECEYNINTNGKRQHSNSCPSCKINAKIANVRVTTFEDPLPESECERNAIIFELQIPVEIACVRDVLYELVKLLNEPAKKIKICDKWNDALAEYDNTVSERVFLGSTVKGKLVGRNRSRGMCEFNIKT